MGALTFEIPSVNKGAMSTPTAKPAPPLAIEQQQSEKILYIPDTLSRWPWRRVVNPHQAEVEEESREWLRSFSRFTTNSRWLDIINNSMSGKSLFTLKMT
jgi:hypothetical protein